MIDDISVDISVVLGMTRMPIHQLLRLGRGAVIALDAREEDDVMILANNKPVAQGQVVIEDQTIGVSITEVITGPNAVR